MDEKDYEIPREDLFGILYLINKESPFFRFKTKLQKLILIARIEFKYPFSFSFKPYYYGPYCEEINNVLGLLFLSGLIRTTVEELNDNSIYKYQLTEDGLNLLKSLSNKEEFKSLSRKIDDLWSKFAQKTIREIVDYAKRISGIESITT